MGNNGTRILFNTMRVLPYYVGSFVHLEDQPDMGEVFLHWQSRDVAIRKPWYSPMAIPVWIVEEADRRGVKWFVVGTPKSGWWQIHRDQLMNGALTEARGWELQVISPFANWKRPKVTPKALETQFESLIVNPFEAGEVIAA